MKMCCRLEPLGWTFRRNDNLVLHLFSLHWALPFHTHTSIILKVIAKTFFQLKSFQETFREKCNNDPYPGYCKVQPQEEPVLRHPDESTFVFSCSRPFYTLTSSALVEKKVASVNKDKKKGPQIGIDLITAKVAVAREMQ